MSHQVGLEDLLKVVEENNPQSDTDMLTRAYECARNMHEG